MRFSGIPISVPQSITKYASLLPLNSEEIINSSNTRGSCQPYVGATNTYGFCDEKLPPECFLIYSLLSVISSSSLSPSISAIYLLLPVPVKYIIISYLPFFILYTAVPSHHLFGIYILSEFFFCKYAQCCRSLLQRGVIAVGILGNLRRLIIAYNLV